MRPAAARASLADPEQVIRSRHANAEGISFLERALPGRGIRVTPSLANFVLAKFPGSAVEATRTLERLGVIIRPMTSFGLPAAYARISVGTRLENDRLIEALAKAT